MEEQGLDMSRRNNRKIVPFQALKLNREKMNTGEVKRKLITGDQVKWAERSPLHRMQT